jgi:hypothetical protein
MAIPRFELSELCVTGLAGPVFSVAATSAESRPVGGVDTAIVGAIMAALSYGMHFCAIPKKACSTVGRAAELLFI